MDKEESNVKFHLISISIIIITTLAIYANSLKNEFVWDDKIFIVENPNIKSWENIKNLIYNLFNSNYFSLSHENYYRPLITLSYAVNYSLGDLNPFIFHFTNILFHSLNSIIIYLIFSSIFKNKFIPFFTAIIFSVHPIQTEAVTFIPGRVDVIAGFFYFLSIYLYLKKESAKKSGKIYYFCSIFLFGLSLLAKEMAITLPLIIVLLDYFFSIKINDNKEINTYEKILIYLPYFVISIIYIFFRFFILNSKLSIGKYFGGSFYFTMLTMSKVFLYYIKLLVLPIRLNADYVFPVPSSLFEPQFIFSAFILGIILILTIKIYRYKKELAFASLWFFITLLPVSNIIPLSSNFAAERYLYIPLVSFALILSIFINKLYFVAKKESSSSEFLKWSSTIIIISIFAFYSIRTIHRNTIWANELNLWKNTVSASPNSSRAHNNLGLAYKDKNLIDEAVKEYKEALRINPKDFYAYHNLGVVYYNLGVAYYKDKNLIDKAIEMYKKALRISPNYFRAHYNLGLAYKEKGLIDEAIEEYKKALKINPNHPVLYFYLGIAYIDKGLMDNAIKEYENVLKLAPNFYEAHNNIGIAYSIKGLFNKAIEEYKKALKIEPNFPEAHNNLALIYQKKGLLDNAIEEYKKALKINPNFYQAHYNLGNAFMMKNLFNEAIEEYKKVLKINPGYFNARTRLLQATKKSKKY